MAKRTKFSRKSAPRRFPDRQVGRAADLSTPPASRIFTEKGKQLKPCFKKGRGKSELIFVSAKDAERYGIPAGPTVRLCSGSGQPGHLVHAANPCQAQAVAKAWRKCSGSAKGKKQLDSCAVEAKQGRLASCPREDYATLHGMEGRGKRGRQSSAKASAQLARDWDRAARLLKR